MGPAWRPRWQRRWYSQELFRDGVARSPLAVIRRWGWPATGHTRAPGAGQMQSGQRPRKAPTARDTRANQLPIFGQSYLFTQLKYFFRRSRYGKRVVGTARVRQ